MAQPITQPQQNQGGAAPTAPAVAGAAGASAPFAQPWNAPPGGTALDQLLSFKLGPFSLGARGSGAVPMPDVATYAPSTMSTVRYATPAPSAPPVTQSPMAPLDFGQLNLTPNRPIDPRFGSAPDPTQSPAANALNDMTLHGEAANAYMPLRTAPNVFDRAVDFFSTPNASKPTIDQRAETAQFYQRPEVMNAVLGNKDLFDRAQADPMGTRAGLEPLLQAAQSAPITAVNGKPVTDPSGLAAKMQATGLPAEKVAPFHEPHNYTEEEFINAAHGISYHHLQMLMGMQHYLTPQQQAFGVLQENYSKVADSAKAAYDAAVKNGSPAGKVEDLKNQANMANGQLVQLLRSNAVPPATYPFGLNQGNQ